MKSIIKHSLSSLSLGAILCGLAGNISTALGSSVPLGANIVKASSGTDLTAGASWTGGVAPGVGDIATWNSTSLGAGLTLGAPESWLGISISGAASDIGVTGVGPLTLGTNGVDMSTSTNNFSMGTPIILGANQTWNVNSGETMTMLGVISGTNGLTEAGSGMLTLTNANTFTGGTTVNGGTLALDYNVGDTPTGTLAGGSIVNVNSGGTLLLNVEDVLGFNGGIPAALNINGGLVTSADVANTTSVQNGGTSFRVTLPQVNFTGGTLSSGVNNQGDNYGGSYLASSFNTLSNTATAVINAYSISLTGAATFNVAAGNTPSGVDLEVSSSLRDWFDNPPLTKAGAGFMELDQNGSIYGSAVNVNGGTLFLNGTLGNGGVNVAANGKFLAQGSVGGPITVATGGTFGVGYTNINALSSFSSVTFNSGSTNFMKISKTGGTAQSDQVQTATSVTFAGTLIVTNITSDSTAIAAGDSFSFYPYAGAYHGTFSNVVLPALPIGLGWDISQLGSAGIIQVSSSAAPPTFNPPAGGYAGSLNVTISSLTPGATIYYTTDGTTPTTASPSGLSPLTVALPADTNITIQAFASGTGYSASSVQSAAYSTYTNYTWINASGGNWSGIANWSNNAVANGIGTPADFSQLALIGSPTVTLDIPATVGSMIFGDQANANSWTLADGGAGPLTLNNGTNTPVIVVSNQTTTISAALAGTSGFVKTGSGTLALDNANVNSGPLVVNNGTVALNYNPNDGPTGTLAPGTTNTINAGATLLLNVEDVMGYGNGGTAQLNINGGLVTSANVANTTSVQNGGTSFRVTMPPVTFNGGTLSSGTNNEGDNYGGSFLMSSVTTYSNATTAVINAYKVSMIAGSASVFNVASGNTPSGVDLSVSSILINWGGNFNLTKNGSGFMTLSGVNTYSGGTSINGGILNLANVNALGAAGTSLNLNATGAAAELSTDVGFGGTNPVYDVTLSQTGPYVGTMILNRATPGSSTPITHNFGTLTLSLNGGAPTALNVVAGPNAPIGGVVDTLAFNGLNFGAWYNVTETLAPTNANMVMAGTVSAESSQASSPQVATLDLDGTSTGNQITGAIVDNASGSTLNKAAILKSNTGKWTLSGTNTYTGNTTIAGGTLALSGGGSISNSPSIVIAGGATFDVSGLSMPFALGAGQTLGNSGSTAVLAGSASTGTGTLSLNYTNGMPALTVSGGTLTLSASTVFSINNTGSQLPGGTYTLIYGSSGGVVAGTVPTGVIAVGGSGAVSTANLVITNGDLDLVVTSSVNSNPTKLISSVSAGSLNLSWPADHLGWTLQTNSVGLTATNQWFAYPGSTSVTNVSIPINHSGTNVFFRMVYP